MFARLSVCGLFFIREWNGLSHNNAVGTYIHTSTNVNIIDLPFVCRLITVLITHIYNLFQRDILPSVLELLELILCLITCLQFNAMLDPIFDMPSSHMLEFILMTCIS